MIQLLVAQRGRGGETVETYSAQRWHQQLEINYSGVCNSLTTVSKDNMILEIDDDRNGASKASDQAGLH